MKRSEINVILADARRFIASQKFYLPAFAYWTPADWRSKGPEVWEIVERNLGWDITDFGSGDYPRRGLFLFTLRNGSLEALRAARGKAYCEKLLIADVDQVTPTHFHWQKTEDIINRGGGRLVIQLWNALPDGELDSTEEVVVSVDGVVHHVPAASKIVLHPGESITLVDGMYHQFWAEGQRVLAGEVSLVNDDSADNRFYDQVGRFPAIEEDEEPLHLLVGDYQRYYTYVR
jgi:D-lyxose ketol-isomerase